MGILSLCAFLVTLFSPSYAWQIETNRLQDLRIGEQGQVTRIALFCRLECQISQLQDGFLLVGIEDALTLNVANLSENINEIRMRSYSGSSVLEISSERVLLRSSMKRCKLNNGYASCIDLEFSRQPYQRKFAKAQSTKADKVNTPTGKKPQGSLTLKKQQQSAISLSVPQSNQGPQKLTLRNADSLSQSVVANTEEVRPRLDLKDGTQSTLVHDVSEPVGAGDEQIVPANLSLRASTPASLSNIPRSRPSILKPAETKLLLGRLDFREQAELVLGKRIDSAICRQAKQEISRDAWALDAMRMVGFCEGADGDFEQAEVIFRRLNTQQPADYEALVGRAIIAAITDEKSIALRLFQDALKTRPPQTVSSHIEDIIALY